MKKEFILIAALVFSGILLFLSLIEFKNPIVSPGNIEQNLFVLAVGIDKATEGDNKIRLTIIGEKFGSSDTKSSSSQGKTPDITSVEGTTIIETIRNFNLFKSKSLFWGHIKYILISEDIAKENILDVLDFFIRDHELRLNTKVVVVKDISAESFLRIGDNIQQFIPDLLDGVFHNVGKLSISSEIKLSDIMKTFDSVYSDAYIPSIGIVTLKKDEVESDPKTESDSKTGSDPKTESNSQTGSDSKTGNDSQSGSNTQSGSSTKAEGSLKTESISPSGSSSQIGSGSKITSSSQKESNTQGGSSKQDGSGSSSGGSSSSGSDSKDVYYLNLDGYATFNGVKLFGYISDFTARGLNWVNGKVQGGIIVLKDSKGKNVSMEIIRSNSETKINFNGEVPEANVNIKFASNLVEIMSQNNLFNQEDIKKIREEQEKIVKKEVESAIEYAQKNSIDIIEMNDAIYHQYPLKWEKIKDKWEETFKTMKVTVNVDLTSVTVYHIRAPIGSKSGEDK